MNILSLDPALNNFGYAVFKIQHGKFFYSQSGVLQNKKDKNLLEKLSFIQRKLIEIVKQEEITHLVLEESFVNKNAASSLKLGILRGLLYSIGISSNLEIESFAATTIKKVITGNGRSEKNILLKSIESIIPNLSIKSLDESDAIAVGLTFVISRRLI